MVKFKVLPNILSVNQKATVNVRKHFCPNKFTCRFMYKVQRKPICFVVFFLNCDLFSKVSHGNRKIHLV